MLGTLDSIAIKFTQSRDAKYRKEVALERSKIETRLIELGLIQSSDIDNQEPLYSSLSNITPKRILIFDTECIENDNDYASLFYTMLTHLKISHDRFDVSSKLGADGNCAFHANTKRQEWSFEWQQDDDYVTSDFIDAVNQVLSAACGYKFLVLPAVSQELELVALKKDFVDEIYELQEAEEEDLRVGWFLLGYACIGAIGAVGVMALFWWQLNSPWWGISLSILMIFLCVVIASFRSDIFEEPLSEEEQRQVDRLEQALGMIENGTFLKK